MLLDLDPVRLPSTSWWTHQLIRQILLELGLKGYPKTTGGDGMHIYVPLEPVYSFEQVRNFAESEPLGGRPGSEYIYHAALRGKSKRTALLRLSAGRFGENNFRALCCSGV